MSRTVPLVRVRARCRRSCRLSRSTRWSAPWAAGGIGRWSKRCCSPGCVAEVLGLRLGDVHVADRRVFVVDGKGGHQRFTPMANRFFTSVGHYLDRERPPDTDTERVFVALKGRRRGRPLTAAGLDEVLTGARRRAGLTHGTPSVAAHLSDPAAEAGMSLEAVQAQAGHRSIESTRVYLHLTNDWLAEQYQRAATLIDANQAAVAEMLAAQELAAGQ